MHMENGEYQLISRLKKKEPQACSLFIDKYQGLVASIAYKMIPSEAEREDVCQDIFIKAMEKIGSFRMEAKLSSWMARISYNHCLNYLRRQRLELPGTMDENSEVLFSESNETPESEVIANDRREWLWRMIDALPVQQGLIVHLFHVQEFKYQEIAKIMNMPEGTVKNYLFRARKKLKENLEKYMAVEDIQL